MRAPRSLTLVLLNASIAFAGCGSSSTNANPVAVDSGTVSSDASADTNGADTDAGKPLAPNELRSFETSAEGVGDTCKLADFVKAGNVLGESVATWSGLEAQVKAAGASDALLKRIDDAMAALSTDISSKGQKACETDANIVTLAVPDLFDLYTWPVPSDALRGDGVFRQLQIDGEYADWTRTADDLKTTKDVWSRLQPMTADKAPTRGDIPGATTVVADLDKAIADCETAIGAHDAAALQAASQSGLDAIDVVEAIFK